MRQHRTRTILAVTLIATAICADRAAVAAGQRSQAGQRIEAESTGGFARRLTVSLRQAVRAIKLHQGRVDVGGAITVAIPTVAPQALGRVAEQTPFEFRLPPPSIL
ncbi:MAG: hypothetical protein ACAI43_10855 [Phycisphaerae bacterium]|nr:hypothetical protein [Tepidisphaeraceae bacterium]